MKSEKELVLSIESLLRKAGVPGCSLAVVGQDGVTWSHSFGYADLLNGGRAERSTIYHLFSGTKLFTATAALQLVERGELDLDAGAKTHLPDLPQLGDTPLRALLSHTSGLRDTLRGFLAVYFPGEAPLSTREALAAYRLRASGARERKVQYRNVNYAVLGEIVSRKSGLDYRDYIRHRILAPLGSDAEFEVSKFHSARLATGYLNRWDPTRVLLRLLLPAASKRLYRGWVKNGLVALNDYNLSTAAIGGLIGSVDSFAPFLQSQLNHGFPLLREETTKWMQTLVARGRAGVESTTGVGLGWKVGDTNGRRFLNHEGSGAGFRSELRLYPDEGLGMVVLMNKSSLSRTMRVAHETCELIRKNRGTLP